MKWLDAIPLPALLLAGIMMALAPFAPEPHLVEKLRMLSMGQLHRPIDIFDLLLHLTPLLIALLKVVRVVQLSKRGD